MRPLFKSGSYVFVEAICPEEFASGDTICYEQEGEKFIHRITRIVLKPTSQIVDHFVVNSDSAVTLPEKIYPEHLIGRPLSGLNGALGAIAGKFFNFTFPILRWIKHFKNG